MNRWRRAALTAAAGLLGLAGVAALATVTGVLRAEHRMQHPVAVPHYPLALRRDAAAAERGRDLYAAHGCAGCHGADGAGRSFAQREGLHLVSPNISPGPGSVVAGYRPSDWERALRHGVKPDGRPLRAMPIQDTQHLSDADLGALVAYVRQLPPLPGRAAVVELPLRARVLYGWGLLTDIAALM